MSKRVKLSYENICEYDIIPQKKIAKTNTKIKKTYVLFY